MNSSSSADPFPAQDVIEKFIWWVQFHPEADAVVALEQKTSYGELYRLALNIAEKLRTISISPRVLISQIPSKEAYASIIATLMTGGIFCPINVNQPEARTNLILSAFRPDVVLSTSGVTLPPNSIPVLFPEEISNLSVERLNPSSVELEIGGYVIFTSGSTGIPKGVIVRRTCISKFVKSFSQIIDVKPTDRWAQFSNLGFDLSIVDIFMTLASGAALAPVTSPSHRLIPTRCINDLKITIWHSVPSVVDLMASSGKLDANHLSSLRFASFCGEPLKLHHVEYLLQCVESLSIVNTYGPTEGTLFCTAITLDKNNYKSHFDRSFAIGKPLDGWHLDLIANTQSESHSEGEIVISGEYLSDGYINDQDLTAKKFIFDKSVSGNKSYLTGDWGERLGDDIFFRHRIDRQVKIKGNRFELGEIEFHLNSITKRNCFVLQKDGLLIAAIEGEQFMSESELREMMRKRLPDYALPSRFLWIGQFPRNSNDKIDYANVSSMITQLVIGL